MIQTYIDLKNSTSQIQEKILDQANGKCQFQKIYSTADYIAFTLRIRGSSYVIYLGRGNQAQGLWLSTYKPPSSLRVRDRYLEYLRKHIEGKRFAKIELDQKDRIVKIVFGKDEEFDIYFFVAILLLSA